MLRQHHAAPRSKQGYGLHLGKFVSRSRFVNRGRAGWRRRAVFDLRRAINATWKAPLVEDPMIIEPWFSETYYSLKQEFSAPKVRCRRPSPSAS